MRRLALLVAAVAVVVAGVVVAAGSAGGGEAHAWSSALPSGEIVFKRWVGSGSHLRPPSSLYVMAPDGLRVRLLVPDASAASVSRDGREIAFVRGRAIWLMRRDGSRQRQLTRPPGASVRDFDPAWADDGRTIYFSRNTGGSSHWSIFSVRVDETQLRRLTKGCGFCATGGEDGAAPSSGQDIVAYTFSEHAGGGEGSRVRAVTKAGRAAKLGFKLPRSQYVSDPGWAPIGRQLAYAVNDTTACDPHWDPTVGRTGIWISSSDGSPPRRVARLADCTARGSEFYSPAWSQDAAWIVYVYVTDGVLGAAPGELWLVRSDGTGAKPLTHTKAATDPVWLPPAK